MNLLQKIQLRVQALFTKRKLDAEMDEEMRSHVDLRTQSNIEAGMESNEARFAALREFGWKESIKETCREQRCGNWIESLWRDLHFAVRMLCKNPGFTTVAVLTLALGIGANTTIFTLANSALLWSLPVEKPDELGSIFFGDAEGHGTSNHSYPDYLDYRRSLGGVFSAVAAFTAAPANLLVGQGTERVSAGLVSDNYFSLLGIQPIVGRTFLQEENEVPGAHPVAVISEGLWRRQFGGDRNLDGKAVLLNNLPYTVVGVVSERAAQMAVIIKVDVFVPAMMQGPLRHDSGSLSVRENKEFMVMGRLRPDITLAQAQSELNVIATRLAGEYPKAWVENGRPHPLTVIPENRSRIPFELRGWVVGFIGLLMGAAGAVLLIACGNLASFLLARARARHKEIAVRIALGATRGRLIRQLITESLLLSIAGGMGGLLLAFWAGRLLTVLTPDLGVPVSISLGVDYRVLAFNSLASLLTAFVFGMAPAFQATKLDVAGELKDAEQTQLFGRRRFIVRDCLLTGQIAASLICLLCAGMFWRSLTKLHSVDIGFNPNQLALLSVDLTLQGYSPEKGKRFYQQALDRFQQSPAIESADAAARAPLGLSRIQSRFLPVGREVDPSRTPYFGFNIVGTRYFETMGIPLLKGRSFTDGDRQGAPRVAIINESFARRFWQNNDAIGQRLRDDNGNTLEIVGVCKTGKYDSLSEEPMPFVYLPLLQNYVPSLTFHVRTKSKPEVSLSALRQELLSLDPNLAVFDVKTMDEHLALSLLPVRVGSMLLGVFGGLALVLAAIGLYGVMSYAVIRRTREIGIRMSLGAQRRDVLGLIVREGVKTTAAGVITGLVLGFGATVAIASQLYGVSATDLATLGGVSLIPTTVALLACYIPARRAAKVDPIVALRYE